jgi:hypothetical protein
MRRELEQKAREFLAAHFSPIASHTGRRDLYELRYEMHDGAKADIYRLIMNGPLIAEVQNIAQKTRHGTLRDYLLAITKAVTAKLSQSGGKPAS